MSEYFDKILPLKKAISAEKSFDISGLDKDAFIFLYKNFIDESIGQNCLFLFETDDDAQRLASKFKNAIYFPGLGANPYSSIIPSQSLMDQRYFTLKKISKTKERIIIFTTLEALQLKQVPKEHFEVENFKINTSDIIPQDELKTKLINSGYQYTPSIEEPGTFTNKGEIFDVFPFNQEPIRIHYFDDMIEEIFAIDLETLKTNRKKAYESIDILSSSTELISSKNILNLRDNLYKPALAQKEKIKYRNEIFHKLNNGFYFDRYPIYLSSFFTNHSNLLDFIKNPKVFIFNKSENVNAFATYIENIEKDFQNEVATNDSQYVSPSVQKIYYTNSLLPEDIISINNFESENDKFSFKFEDLGSYVKSQIRSIKKDKFEYIKSSLSFIRESLKESGELFVVHRDTNSKIEMDFLLEQNMLNMELAGRIHYLEDTLDKGFCQPSERVFFLSDADLFSRKIKKSSTRKQVSRDVFAEQLATLKEGDFVIHKNFGVGKYLGMEVLELGKNKNDFLVLEYEGSDKVYVPVYKLDLIQKHSESTAQIKLSNLNSKKFEQQKSKAKSSVKKLAFDLLELQAKRESQKGYAFSSSDHQFKEFELAFMFQETPDQLNAIDDVIADMEKIKPMDRLVCGDVGFGKTEVAMRAAYKAVLDGKQVAILVPTTVLALQHFNSFSKRFKNFAVNIDYLSRFKTPKQEKEVIENLAEGKIDIVIGTHKLLSEKIKYKDLGVLVIDEEQRFGVTHKEKLKLIKSNVDCLTLTATPIPRTLQLSFLGIKDLSIIKSAPPSRQSIKSYVIKEDPNTIKAAIQKELNRGGQIFIVHNRVHDIEDYAAYINRIVPEARIIVAHGQLAERELEKRIKKFYEQEYDILVSTTIIESGIDIPSANTMIVDKANHFGLSQLHQLRGRIGRSDKKAYAYFVTPHDSNLSEIATKRLKALQTYADLGSGFSLATNDLEIRGSGDILGAEQSGHISEVGLELYMDLLKQAISELKNENIAERKDIEITTPFNASIPNSYIHDTGSRLKFYKRLSNATSLVGLDEIIDEMSDQYGLANEQVRTLYQILKAKISLIELPIKTVKVSKSMITFKFDKDTMGENSQLRDKVIQFFMSRPKVYKISPNFSVQCKFKDEIKCENFVEFCEYIASQILPC